MLCLPRVRPAHCLGTHHTGYFFGGEGVCLFTCLVDLYAVVWAEHIVCLLVGMPSCLLRPCLCSAEAYVRPHFFYFFLSSSLRVCFQLHVS